MGIPLGPQLLKIIFVGLTGTGYFDSVKKDMGWLPRSGLVLLSIIFITPNDCSPQSDRIKGTDSNWQ
ncbi:MAG: hypothetical protein HGB33_05990 [Syntrophaceae bacterium]|nr:hypothetical protein [Syntrophaceae bacterium]